jgi:ubiquinone/menaquinone biosynthesis C-methylase UbiE
MSESGNKAQIEYWNSDVGRRWAGHQKTIDAMLHGLAELLLEAANIQPGERILDIGCGSGTTTLAVAERVGPSGSVLGVDVSEPMLSLARERVAASGLRNIELVSSDAATCPFEPRRFDPRSRDWA